MRLALAGDTMLGRGVARELAKRAPQSVVSPEIAELTRAADLCIVNLEWLHPVGYANSVPVARRPGSARVHRRH